MEGGGKGRSIREGRDKMLQKTWRWQKSADEVRRGLSHKTTKVPKWSIPKFPICLECHQLHAAVSTLEQENTFVRCLAPCEIHQHLTDDLADFACNLFPHQMTTNSQHSKPVCANRVYAYIMPTAVEAGSPLIPRQSPGPRLYHKGRSTRLWLAPLGHNPNAGAFS